MAVKKIRSYGSGNDLTELPEYAGDPVKIPTYSDKPVEVETYRGPYTLDKAPTYDGQKRLSYEELPQYSGKWQPMIDDLADKLANREGFHYDYQDDPTYRQLAKEYTRNGQRAMQDTMGQAAARTGGIASSYAASAAAGQYNDYMQQLSDRIPELERLAYQMYADEENRLTGRLSALRGLDSDEYGRFRDSLADRLKIEDINYGRFRDEMGDFLNLGDRDYGRWRDEVADKKDAEQTAYNRWLDEVEIGNDMNDRAYGRWRDEVADFEALDDKNYSRYRDTQEDKLAQATLAAKSSSSSGSGSKKSDTKTSFGFSTEVTSDLKRALGYMEEHTKEQVKGNKNAGQYKDDAMNVIFGLEKAGSLPTGDSLEAALYYANIDPAEYAMYRDKRLGTNSATQRMTGAQR